MGARSGWLGWFGVLLGLVWAPVLEAQESEPWSQPLREVAFEFALGDRLHQGRITAPSDVAKVAEAWRVVQRWPEAGPGGPRLLGRWPAVLLTWGSRGAEVFHIAGRNQLHSDRWGRLILDPDLFRVIETWTSQQEGARVRLGVENPFPEDRLEALRRFQALAQDPWVRATMDGPEGPVEWYGVSALQPLREAFHGWYIPKAESVGTAWGHALQITALGDQRAELILRDGSQAPTRPLHSVLLQHSVWGPVWVSDQFRERWLDGYGFANPFEAVPEQGWPQEKQAASAALQALAAGESSRILHRTTDWDLERQAWVPVVRAVEGLRGSRSWRELWAQPALRPLRLSAAERAGRWQEWKSLGSRLTWWDSNGRSWTLLGAGSDEVWLSPAWQVSVPSELWSLLLDLQGKDQDP